MMEFDIFATVQRVSVIFIPALLGIILHEVAHGWVADRLGDPTARFMGRLTINPLPHIDPLGLAVFVLTSALGGFVFGWARPVPVNPRHFRNPAKGMMLVALAGPVTNLLLALVMALLLRVVLEVNPADGPVAEFVVRALYYGAGINVGLACLNLLPIPPLDGSRVLAYFLPFNVAVRYMSVERYGMVILIGLMALGLLDKLLLPLMLWCLRTLFSLFGLPM
ncbi:MAG: site-2 protease family protein [Desulfovibrio sp.]|uniref:site-2 protease family protein n=1 Tax=Desulfovibrio sp. TaxID=885 RepID=UPI0025C0DC17|nr:site-2 protease family protein [Desulfovibrio sp.]MCI7568923.1 site-2 protease family protein [Desulfovibrio sp.]